MMFLQDLDLCFIHIPSSAMGPADTLSRLIDPNTSSDNTNITLLLDDLFIRALDTILVAKITSSTLTDPLVLDALKSLSTGSPLFPCSSLTDWHFSDSHLYFKTIFISLLTLVMTLLLLCTHPSPLAMEGSFALTPCCLRTTGGQVCPPLFAVLSLAVPFASR